MAVSRSARITLLLFIDVIFFLVELIVGMHIILWRHFRSLSSSLTIPFL